MRTLTGTWLAAVLALTLAGCATESIELCPTCNPMQPFPDPPDGGFGGPHIEGGRPDATVPLPDGQAPFPDGQLMTSDGQTLSPDGEPPPLDAAPAAGDGAPSD